MSILQKKRQTDLQVITDWVEQRSKVLDLGCGRGLLLEHLRTHKAIYGIGVDIDPEKILACIKRGLNVYQGDAELLLKEFPDGYFDWVICSRTVQELYHPGRVIQEALRVGRHLAMGFVNAGYWLNRWHFLLYGERVVNEVYSHTWDQGPPSNPVSIRSFERYCQANLLCAVDRVYLRGDWKTPCTRWANWRAGYAIYHLMKKETSGRKG